MNNLESCLKESEGYESSAYQDSLGYWTIGYGFCIDKKKSCGLYPEEAEFILKNRIQRATNLINNFSWFKSQDCVRQEVLVELTYCIGLDGLLGFSKPGGMISLMVDRDYNKAAEHLLASLWAKQVGKRRSQNVAERIKTGHY